MASRKEESSMMEIGMVVEPRNRATCLLASMVRGSFADHCFFCKSASRSG